MCVIPKKKVLKNYSIELVEMVDRCQWLIKIAEIKWEKFWPKKNAPKITQDVRQMNQAKILCKCGYMNESSYLRDKAIRVR